MDQENKRMFKVLPWLFALTLLGIFLHLLQRELAQQDELWEQHLAQQQTIEQTTLLAAQDALTQKAMFLAQTITQDQAVLLLIHQAYLADENASNTNNAATSARLRKQLNEQLQPHWARMAALNVSELNIHLSPSGTVFLRAQNPDDFDDDIAWIQPMAMDVLTRSEARSGIEVGQSGSAVRAIVPVMDNQLIGQPTIAAIEVAISLQQLINTKNKSFINNQGRAIFLHPSLIKTVLIGNVQMNVLANRDTTLGQWGLESFTDTRLKKWLSKGLLFEPSNLRITPTLLHEQDQDFVVFNHLLGDQKPALKATEALLLSWNDITPQLIKHNELREKIELAYLLGLIIAELALWLLLYVNKRHLKNVLNNHSQQLQHERNSSERSRQHLALALKSNGSGYWEWNLASNRAQLSKDWRELCGLPANDSGDTDVEEWLERIHPTDKISSYTDMIRHIKGEVPFLESEYRLRVADGSYKWVLTRGKVVEWLPNGRALVIIGIYTDITERKKNELTVIKQQGALNALIEITSFSGVDAEAQLQNALIVGTQYFSLSAAVISNIQGNQYHTKIHINANTTDALSHHVCELTYQQHDIFACDNISSSDYADHPAHKKSQTESYIGIPIWFNGEIYGTLCFMSMHSRHQPYDDLDKDFMRLLGGWVTATLERWQHQTEQQILVDRFTKLNENLPGFVFQFQQYSGGSHLFTYASAGVSEIYNVDPNEIRISSVKIFNKVHPDDVGWLNDAISISAATLTPWSATFRVQHATRGVLWVHTEAKPEQLEDGSTLWHGFQADVTAAKCVELKLQESNIISDAIFDAAGIAIIVTDKQGRIKKFNRGAETMLGYSAVEIINICTPIRFHLPEEIIKSAELLSRELGSKIAPHFEVLIAKAREGYENESEWTYVRKDGSHCPISLRVSALRNAAGDINGYVSLSRDISEIKRIDTLRSDFISTVSHELRTPLTSINGALGIIKSGAAGDLPETATQMLNITQKNSTKLMSFVSDLLDRYALATDKMNVDMHAKQTNHSREPTGNRILIVEDNDDMAEVLAIMLRNCNYRVDIAYNGRTALQRLALYTYQLVTIDLQLPDMHGIQLIKQLRSDSSTQRIPIVVISAHLDEQSFDVKKDSMYADITWLEKPAVATVVITTINNLLMPTH